MTPYSASLKLTNLYFGVMTAASATLFSIDLSTFLDMPWVENLQAIYDVIGIFTGHFGAVDMVEFLYGDQKMFEGIESYKALGFYVLGPFLGGFALRLLEAWGFNKANSTSMVRFLYPPLANIVAAIFMGGPFVYIVMFWPVLLLIAFTELIRLFGAMLPEDGGSKIVGQVLLNLVIAIIIITVMLGIGWLS